jgi:hypothetical protein
MERLRSECWPEIKEYGSRLASAHNTGARQKTSGDLQMRAAARSNTKDQYQLCRKLHHRVLKKDDIPCPAGYEENTNLQSL